MSTMASSTKKTSGSSSISDEEKLELHKGWFEFLRSCTASELDDEKAYIDNCGHIYGFNKDDQNVDETEGGEETFRLSMLQRITSRRVLDYKKLETDVSSIFEFELVK